MDALVTWAFEHRAISISIILVGVFLFYMGGLFNPARWLNERKKKSERAPEKSQDR